MDVETNVPETNTTQTNAPENRAPEISVSEVKMSETKASEVNMERPINMQPVGKVHTPYFAKLMNESGFFVPVFFFYALIFTTCLYPGFGTITMPVISLVTVCLLACLCKRWSMKLTAKDIFYFVAWILLAVSNCRTMSSLLVFFNCLGMVLLLFSFMLNHFADTSEWGFPKYFAETVIALFKPFGYLGYPFSAIKAYFSKNTHKKSKNAKYVWLGLLLALPVFVVVIALLCRADVVFKEFMRDVLRYIRLPQHPIWMIFLFFVGLIVAFAFVASLADSHYEPEKANAKTWEPIVGITFLAVLLVVYVLFCGIQISYLFTGQLTLPAGYTYSQYAREGYYELLLVCVINLVIILLFIHKFSISKALNILMTLFSVCTYIMIASSAIRLVMYVQTYALTFRRLLAMWSLLLIAVVLIGAAISIWKHDFKLFHYAVAVVTVCFVVLSLARPDAVIARYNLAQKGDKADIAYLVDTLSADTVPALNDFGIMDRELIGQFYDLKQTGYEYDDMEPLDFNFSLNKAGSIIRSYVAE